MMEEDSVYAYNDEYEGLSDKEKRQLEKEADGFVKFLEQRDKLTEKKETKNR